MKLKLLLPLFLLGAATAHAHLIDPYPDGWSSADPRPQPDFFYRIFNQAFFDSAVRGLFQLPGDPEPRFYNQWVGQFGALDGSDWFETSLFDGDNPFASISWDMTGEPHRFYVNMVYVSGFNDGVLWEHVYAVSRAQHYIGSGIVTLNGTETIDQIAMYGRVRAPDTGSTLGLFTLGLAALAFWRKK